MVVAQKSQSWPQQLTAFLLIALIYLPAGLADSANPDTHKYNDDKTKARMFCNSPDFNKLTCSAASDAEEGATKGGCIYCGTMWSVMPQSAELPKQFSNNGQDWYSMAQTISLACHGRVVVRVVFKITQQDKNCQPIAGHIDAGNPDEGDIPLSSPIVRCELQLPAGSGDEASRAVKAKEAKCWRCDKGRCPSKVGVWYSESYTKVVPGCDQKFTDKYDPPKVGMILNPRSGVFVAKFEVCNSPSCFDAAYEDKKVANAIIAEKRDC